MPCTSSWAGNLFLIIGYGYLMYLAATHLSTGSELLLQILGPGIVGGLFLPILGSLPDALLILVSGLSGNPENAQSEVSVGMGLLAGSTVLLLTLIWGSCVIVGKCDLGESRAIDGQNTKGFNLLRSGVSTDIWTCYAARIMAISIFPFLVVQLPQIFKSNSGRHLGVLIALIISVVLLLCYCIYQVLQPSVQRRRMSYAKHKHVMSGILRDLRKRDKGKLMGDDGQPDREVIKRLFSSMDTNGDGYLSAGELKALIIGIQFEEMDLDKDDAVEKVMRDFDISRDGRIEEDEFVNGVTKWLVEARQVGGGSNDPVQTQKYIDYFHRQTKREHELLGEDGDDEGGGIANPRRNSLKAVLFLLLGTIIAAAISDPLVDAVNGFSKATRIPSFFISFIALPFATNSSEAVSAIIFSSRKKITTSSLTFSELYGAATMNNLLCLSVFLGLVYIRGLTWDFSSEVLVILIVCLLMGGFASYRTTFPLWTCFLAYALYPFSLALVYVLDYVFNWS
ncbi:sodium/calcium exchanger NCL-like [Rutidosis leptorrhynchoides]|uniref:sodium/calcium exchanger NCL-like n=1 Tax=Rutidosis leptorrhynchoides TaxID=125765 RepID=UPI003A9A2AF2